MIAMGYEREAIVQSVTNRAYDEIYATYMLLGTKEPEEWVWKVWKSHHVSPIFGDTHSFHVDTCYFWNSLKLDGRESSQSNRGEPASSSKPSSSDHRRRDTTQTVGSPGSNRVDRAHSTAASRPKRPESTKTTRPDKTPETGKSYWWVIHMTNRILATDVKRSLSYKAPDRRRQRNPEISPPLTKVSFIKKYIFIILFLG